jgi:hypothetical protein
MKFKIEDKERKDMKFKIEDNDSWIIYNKDTAVLLKDTSIGLMPIVGVGKYRKRREEIEETIKKNLSVPLCNDFRDRLSFKLKLKRRNDALDIKVRIITNREEVTCYNIKLSYCLDADTGEFVTVLEKSYTNIAGWSKGGTTIPLNFNTKKATKFIKDIALRYCPTTINNGILYQLDLINDRDKLLIRLNKLMLKGGCDA